MGATKSRRAGRMTGSAPVTADLPDHDGEEADPGETYGIYRVGCPECAQPIALLSAEERLPEHALCATWWDPFGMTVCPGSHRPVAHALSTGEEIDERGDAASLLTLPEGLDWRTQPFSHVGGRVSGPLEVAVVGA